MQDQEPCLRCFMPAKNIKGNQSGTKHSKILHIILIVNQNSIIKSVDGDIHKFIMITVI